MSETPHRPPLGLAARALAQGHAWLRFPAPLESQFKADTLEPRRKLLMICGLIGIVSICLGSAKLAELMPDIVAVAFRNLAWILGISLLATTSFWVIPPHWRRTWQAELFTAIPLCVLNAGLIYGCMVSRADTTFTHSAALVSSLMYACICARLRFAWSLGCALISFLGYVTLARPSTPLQALIVDSTTDLMVVSYVFALVANYAFEYNERRNWLLRRLAAEQHDALAETSERLHRLSTQDPLTGLFNRRQFDAELAQAWSQALATQGPLSMLIMDVDFFKRYNDTHGHLAGDACLVRIAQVLTMVAQAHGGIAARLGGEEFGLLLPSGALEEALKAGTGLCEGVHLAGLPHQASSVSDHVTVSVGAAQLWPAQGGDLRTLEELADRALYRAKEGGRHRVCAANADDVSHTIAQRQGRPAWHAEAATADVATLSPSAQSQYTEILQGGFRKLRFPATQEAYFREHNADERRKHLLVMTVLGLVIHNIYALSSRNMFPDIQRNVLSWQVGLSALLLLLAGVSHVTTMPVHRRELIFSLGTSVLAVMSAWVLSQSHQFTTLSYVVCLALIPMFAGVGARQPFRFTFMPSVITCVAVACLMRPVGALETLVFSDSVLMIITNTVFTLILAYTLEHGTRNAWLLSQIEHLQGDALQEATRSLHELSMRDPLTGIRNRRQFEEDFKRLWADSLQSRQPLALLMIDVDFFKHYNDGHGHPSGDRCLKQVATILDQVAAEGQGLSARLGGEEFVILLSGANTDRASALAARVCAAVREARIEHAYTKVPGLAIITVSVGVACLVADATLDPRSLLAQADEALYTAKEGGRNRTAVWAPRHEGALS